MGSGRATGITFRLAILTLAFGWGWYLYWKADFVAGVQNGGCVRVFRASPSVFGLPSRAMYTFVFVLFRSSVFRDLHIVWLHPKVESRVCILWSYSLEWLRAFWFSHMSPRIGGKCDELRLGISTQVYEFVSEYFTNVPHPPFQWPFEFQK